MSSRIQSALIALASLLALAACASPGAPQPPSLKLPLPVDDLTVTRKGAQVTLSWTPPTKTSDGENIQHASNTLICREMSGAPMNACGTPVATLSDAQVEHWTKGTAVPRRDYLDTLPDAAMANDPTGYATYALEDQNPRGRSAGLSKQVRISLAPTLPAPANVQAKVVPEGVQLSWTRASAPTADPALSFLYRVFRQSANKPELIVGEVPVEENQSSFLDRNVDWQDTYSYRIAPITRVQQKSGEPVEVEGEDSPLTTVAARDTFAPTTPTGLQAVFSGFGQKPFIDLTWAPNLEPDLAGYDVYRHETGIAPVKINTETVPTPSFRDPNVQPGHEYFYAVEAVDQRGNLSGRSEETSEKVPQ
jgi:hypothetical protein